MLSLVAAILLGSVNDYIQSISTEEGVTLNANEASTKHKCAPHNHVMDCHASDPTLPLPLSPLYLWPTHLGTASLGSLAAGTQHKSLTFLQALQESLSSAFKAGKLGLQSSECHLGFPECNNVHYLL